MQGRSPRTSYRRGDARRGLRAMVLFLAGVAVAMFSASGVLLGQESDPVFVGAGDIGNCNGTGDEATASLVKSINGTVFTIGDNAYPDGTAANFAKCYDPTWGQFKERTKPSVGNHEYDATSDASGYFDYFGAAAGDRTKGYYSYDLGGWHIVVLNSNCPQVAGGCDAGSPQEEWLKGDLAAHRTACSIALVHHPRFSSGVNGDKTYVAPFWSDLYDAGAEVVLAGHDHSYERFAPQDPSGKADPEGIREFVVGTGGAGFTAFTSIKPNSEKRIANTNGVLKMTLQPDGYEWEFVTAPGGTVADSGSARCHDAQSASPTDTAAPAVQPPQQAIATNRTLGTSTVPTKIRWSATDAGSGVAGYELQQSTNGGAFADVALSSATRAAKTLRLQPGNTYQFRVRATDGAGNTSNWVAGRAFVVVTQQEDGDANLVYGGGWTQQALSSAYGGGVSYAATMGSSSQFTFTGQNVAWVSSKGPDRGKATVAIDGLPVATVDLYASSVQTKEVVFSRSHLDPAVSHTITVQATGSKRSASTGTRVDVDAFAVLR